MDKRGIHVNIKKQIEKFRFRINITTKLLPLKKWRMKNAKIYDKFKQELESQLNEPLSKNLPKYIENSNLALSTVFSFYQENKKNKENNFDTLYEKALKNNNINRLCLLSYMYLDNGNKKLINAFKRMSKEPDTMRMIEGISRIKKKHSYNKNHKVKNNTKDELNLLTLRRWHYDHLEEYSKFLYNIENAYDGDMNFIENNISTFMEMLTRDGIDSMVTAMTSYIPDTESFQERMKSTDPIKMYERFEKLLQTSLNKETVRNELLHRHPNLFCIFYWIQFEDGMIKASELINKTSLEGDNTGSDIYLGEQGVRALVHSSITDLRYKKKTWRNVTKIFGKGNFTNEISTSLNETEGKRGRNTTFLLLEEMLCEIKEPIITEISDILAKHKRENNNDTILAVILLALYNANLLNSQYNYRTFHAAMIEKFPNFKIKKGYDYGEALFNAMQKKGLGNSNISIPADRIKNSTKLAKEIQLRFQTAINPNIL